MRGCARARDRTPSRSANSREQTSAAAAPSLIGLHIGSVNGQTIGRAASTSSIEKRAPILRARVVDGMLVVLGADCRHLPLRRAELRHVVAAKSCVDVHEDAVGLVRLGSQPAAPSHVPSRGARRSFARAATGPNCPRKQPCSSRDRASPSFPRRSPARNRGVSDPTRTWARFSAVDADAQAFSTLKTGALPKPRPSSAACPRIPCWPSSAPWVALAKTIASTSPGASVGVRKRFGGARAAKSPSGVSGKASEGRHSDADDIGLPHRFLPRPSRRLTLSYMIVL